MIAIAALTLSSPLTQTAAPFCVGHAFKQGDVPNGQSIILDTPNFAVQIQNRWNDGSVKTALLMGRVGLTANVPRQVNILISATAPAAGAVLTAASIQAAAPTASGQFGTFGVVNLGPLLATPLRTYISNKEMVECHYVARVAGDASLMATFHVRLYVDGRMRVRVIYSNGFLNGTEKVQKDFIPTITIGATVVWSNAGVLYRMSPRARLDQLGWIGVDPQVTPRHDTGYLNRTKLVPNYPKTGPSQVAIDTVAASAYTPGSSLRFTPSMGMAGYQEQIGLLPLWDALYLTSQANSGVYQSVIAHARAINSYGISYFDVNTLAPIRISDFGTWSVSGPSQGGSPGESTIQQDGVSLLTWEKAHHPTHAYLAALLTGDYYFIETCANGALTIYLCNDINGGVGTSRSVEGQMRSRGWSFRSVAQAAAVVPDSMVLQFEFRAWMAGISAQRVAKYVTPSYPAKYLGYEDLFSNRNPSGYAPNGQICNGVAPWEAHFVTQSVSHAYDLEPCASLAMADLATYRTHVQQAPVWITGGTSATEYNFGGAAAYSVNLRSNTLDAFEQAYLPITHCIPANPGMIFYDSFGVLGDGSVVPVATPDVVFTSYNPTNITTNVLGGPGPGSPFGYYANLLPALAFAVDHAATGAQVSWNRFKNATNFSAQDVTADYASNPIWGIFPRSYAQPALLYTPVDSAAVVPTTGPHVVCDTIPLATAGFYVGTHKGLGVTEAEMPVGSLLKNKTAGGIATDEWRITVSAPTAGTFDIGELSDWQYTGPDGTQSLTETIYKNGALLDTGLLVLSTGTTDVTLPVMVGSITSSGITSTGFTLSWSAATDNIAATGYEVSIDGGTTYTNVGNVLTVTETNLAPSTAYAVRVKAYDAAGNRSTPLSAGVSTSASADSVLPTMQGSLSVGSVTASSFTVTWIAASDNIAVAGYEVSSDNGTSYINVNNVLSSTKTALQAATPYNVKVRAYDAAGNRSTPLSVVATTAGSSDATPPVLGGVITITGVTTGGFTASWNAATDNVAVTGYEISVDFGTPAYVTIGNVLTSTRTGLNSATSYNVRVRSFDSAGNRSAAITAAVTTATPATYATSVTTTFQDRNNVPRANLIGMKWAFFDQVTPDVLMQPSAKGTGATTNSSGVATLNITGTVLPPGAKGWLIFSNSDGTATQSNLISFAGPCVVA